MTKILITGGCGFVGSNLIRAIVARGRPDSLVVLDNETMGSPRDLPEVALEYHKGDICDPDQLARAVRGCDTIIHLAANTRVIESIDPYRRFVVVQQSQLIVARGELVAAEDALMRLKQEIEKY